MVLSITSGIKTKMMGGFLALVISLLVSTSFGLQPSSTISLAGTIIYGQRIDVTADFSKPIAISNLRLGFQLDHGNWEYFRDDPARRQLAKDANFELIRFFDFRSSGPRPCVTWNEDTVDGTWKWSDVDLFIRRIYEIGAEPLICLGGFSKDSGSKGLPAGMQQDPATQMPFPVSWAQYCAEWVKHFKAVGLPVRYYEIGNEPQAWFAPNGWNNIDWNRVDNYITYFNAAARSMRQEDPNILISNDFIIHKEFLTYWLSHEGEDVNTLNFHKYDEYRYPYATDEQMFQYAESKVFGPWPYGGYSCTDAQHAYADARGKVLPIINSESNMNSKYNGETDPRMKEIAGAIWLALVLRMEILNGVHYNIYYDLTSDTFGMAPGSKPRYTYYVNFLVGNNLAVGDSIVETSSSSEDVRTLGWIHGQKINLLLICKTSQARTIQLSGLQGTLNVSKIDNTTSDDNPVIHNETISSFNSIGIEGYTIMLLEAFTQ